MCSALLVGVLQEDGERAVATHTVSEDARSVGDHWEVLVHQFRQLQSIIKNSVRNSIINNKSVGSVWYLLRHIGVHAPVGAPRRLRGVQIKAGSHAEIIRVAFARHSDAARTRVWTDHYEAVCRRVPLQKIKLLSEMTNIR